MASSPEVGSWLSEHAWKVVAGLLTVMTAVLGYLFRRHFKRYDEDLKKLDEKADSLLKKLEDKADSLHTKVEETEKAMAARVEGYRVSFADGLAIELRREIDEIKREWSDLRAHIPEHYLPRADFIRDNTILDGKVSAMFRKFDRIEVKLDWLMEQLKQGRASNGQDPGEVSGG